jgi:hypothetical protein
MPKDEYIGPAILARVLGGSTVHRFRGRIVRDGTTGALRFYVNRTTWSGVPKDWPEPEEWTENFDLSDIEWLGAKPENL